MATNEVITVKCNPCVMCNKSAEVKVPLHGFTLWQSGELIQKAMPQLSADDRELLITGTHSDCWERLFAGSEE